MPQPSPSTRESDSRDLSISLVERIDPAIGEATSVMGAVVTELMRRSLRGGVMKIEEELHTFVTDKVDATIADRTPVLEQTASAVAADKAREVAGAEVRSLELWTKEATQELATQMVETERRVTHNAAETARGLAVQIEEAEKRAERTAEAEVMQKIDELIQRGRKNSVAWKGRVRTLEGVVTELRQQLEHEVRERRAEAERLRQEWGQAARQQHAELEELRRAYEAASTRLAELEKPRGVWSKVSGFFKRAPRDAAESAEGGGALS